MTNTNPAAPANKNRAENLRAKAREWQLHIRRHPFSALIRLNDAVHRHHRVFLLRW